MSGTGPEARHCDGDVGPVGADVHTLAAEVVALEATVRLLRHEGLPLALVHQGDGDVSLAAVDLVLARRLGGHVTLLAGDMLAGQHQIRGAAGTTDGTDDGGWAALHVTDQEDVATAGFAALAIHPGQPSLPRGMPMALSTSQSGCSPMAVIKASICITSVCSVGTGRRRPFSSGSPAPSSAQ